MMTMSCMIHQVTNHPESAWRSSWNDNSRLGKQARNPLVFSNLLFSALEPFVVLGFCIVVNLNDQETGEKFVF
jgi:hypothetical protein